MHDPRTCPTCNPIVTSAAAQRGAARAAEAVAGKPTLVEVLADENPARALLEAGR